MDGRMVPFPLDWLRVSPRKWDRVRLWFQMGFAFPNEPRGELEWWKDPMDIDGSKGDPPSFNQGTVGRKVAAGWHSKQQPWDYQHSSVILSSGLIWNGCGQGSQPQGWKRIGGSREKRRPTRRWTHTNKLEHAIAARSIHQINETA